ncbi:MAG: hypothetical protein JW870_00855 [Candidatus Delongbacteria bacterium]|nr:hypothetical protein [Candidatus Delongbacteria bacterium]MBN2821086.1 hypothetical protein [Bacteroidales bacterium]
MKKLILLFVSLIFSLVAFCQPDFTIQDFFADNANSGDKIRIGLEFRNSGTQPASNVVYEYYISKTHYTTMAQVVNNATLVLSGVIVDRTVSPYDYTLVPWPCTSGYCADEYRFCCTWTIPSSYSGQYFVYLVFDPSNAIIESNENNNLYETTMNVTLLSSSVPTLTQWGIIILGLLFLSFASLYLYRKRKISL